MKRLTKYFCFFTFTLILSAASVASQTLPVLDNSDFQSWNDVSLTVKLNDKVDLYLPFTLRLSGNAAKYGEGKAGIGVNLKLTKRFTVTPYYQYVRASFLGRYASENRYIVKAVYKFPTKYVGVSHRSQFEYRDRKLVNSWRYRPSVTIDRKLPEKWVKGLKVYATEEVFYDSLRKDWVRNRFSTGISKVLTKNLTLDLYYLRQDDKLSLLPTVHALGTSWKIKF